MGGFSIFALRFQNIEQKEDEKDVPTFSDKKKK
jgi:hypothetical protein